MSTPAVVIVPDLENPKAFWSIIVNGDGYPNNLGDALAFSVKTHQDAIHLIRQGNLRYFNSEDWTTQNFVSYKFASYGTQEGPRFHANVQSKSLLTRIQDSNYAYLFNPRSGSWKIWVKNYGWVPFQHSSKRRNVWPIS